MKLFIAGVKREWQRLLTQPSYWGALLVLPAVCVICLTSVFSVPVVNNVPMDIVDMDGSSASRDIIFRIDSSPKVQLERVFAEADDAVKRLHQRETFGYMVIPRDLERKLATGEAVEVNAYVNQQNFMLGNILSGEVLSNLISNSLQESAVNLMVSGQSYDQAIANTVPLNATARRLGNSYLNYQSFMLASILPHIWHVLVVVVIIIALGKEFKDGTVAQWYEHSGSNLLLALASKLLIPTLVLALWIIAIDIYIFNVLGAGSYASLGSLIFTGLLTQLCYQAAAITFTAISKSYRTALSMAAFYTTPAFSFVGITFPTFNMDWFAQAWRAFLPITSLMESQNAILHWQAGLSDILPYLLPLAGYTLMFSILAVVALKPRIYQKDLWFQH